MYSKNLRDIFIYLALFSTPNPVEASKQTGGSSPGMLSRLASAASSAIGGTSSSKEITIGYTNPYGAKVVREIYKGKLPQIDQLILNPASNELNYGDFFGKIELKYTIQQGTGTDYEIAPNKFAARAELDPWNRTYFIVLRYPNTGIYFSCNTPSMMIRSKETFDKELGSKLGVEQSINGGLVELDKFIKYIDEVLESPVNSVLVNDNERSIYIPAELLDKGAYLQITIGNEDKRFSTFSKVCAFKIVIPNSLNQTPAFKELLELSKKGSSISSAAMKACIREILKLLPALANEELFRAIKADIDSISQASEAQQPKPKSSLIPNLGITSQFKKLTGIGKSTPAAEEVTINYKYLGENLELYKGPKNEAISAGIAASSENDEPSIVGTKYGDIVPMNLITYAKQSGKVIDIITNPPAFRQSDDLRTFKLPLYYLGFELTLDTGKDAKLPLAIQNNPLKDKKLLRLADMRSALQELFDRSGQLDLANSGNDLVISLNKQPIFRLTKMNKNYMGIWLMQTKKAQEIIKEICYFIKGDMGKISKEEAMKIIDKALSLIEIEMYNTLTNPIA